MSTRSHSFVGIFWAVQPRGLPVALLDHRCPISEAEPYGDMLTCPQGHYEVWEQWRITGNCDRPELDAVIAVDEYEEWPRGRIVYSSTEEHFVLYADAQILKRTDLVAAIRERFGLLAHESRKVEQKLDSHYVSTRRITSSNAEAANLHQGR